MNDWIKLTQEFKNILSREGYPLTPSCEGSAPAPVAINGENAEAELKLLSCMIRMDATQKRTKIASNFVAAAMHLSFLKRSDASNLVDLPDNASMLFHR